MNDPFLSLMALANEVAELKLRVQKLEGTEPDVIEPHDCDSCGATNSACLEMIRKRGRGCCPRCFISDTHGDIR